MSHVLGRLVAVTLDCPDPHELAEFYRHVLGGQLRASNEDFVVLICDGTTRLDFQRVSHHRPSQWPDGETLNAHLDIAVDDLDHAEQQLSALGAVPRPSSPTPPGSESSSTPPDIRSASPHRPQHRPHRQHPSTKSDPGIPRS